MEYPISVLRPADYPPLLREIPTVPEQLYLRGLPLTEENRSIAIVGARKHSAYGAEACNTLISGLAGYPVTIISGLAVGIDAIAHSSALQYHLPTIAVVGSGLDNTTIYPSVNRPLAQRILAHNGTLLSELPAHEPGTKHTFPARNRIIAGLAELVIAIECAERSGTRITTALAVDYGRDVGALPHSIFSQTGAGTNSLLQQGAHVIRHSNDILALLNI